MHNYPEIKITRPLKLIHHKTLCWSFHHIKARLWLQYTSMEMDTPTINFNPIQGEIHCFVNMDHWTWTTGHGPLDMVLWTWTTGHGPLDMDYWTWSSGHGPLDMDLWTHLSITLASFRMSLEVLYSSLSGCGSSAYTTSFIPNWTSMVAHSLQGKRVTYTVLLSRSGLPRCMMAMTSA